MFWQDVSSILQPSTYPGSAVLWEALHGWHSVRQNTLTALKARKSWRKKLRPLSLVANIVVCCLFSPSQFTAETAQIRKLYVVYN